MSLESLTELILQYRYWILIPLSFIEGPIVAFVAGALASLGYFNLYFLCILFFIRDVGMDAVYYAIGYFGERTTLAHRALTRIGITPDHLEHARGLWERKPGVTMFIGKLSYGIASAFIVAAGIVKIPLPRFFKYAILVAVVEYGGLLFAGYFLGNSLGGSAEKIIKNVQYAIAALALVITAYYIFSWRMRQKLLAKDKEIEEMPVEKV